MSEYLQDMFWVLNDKVILNHHLSYDLIWCYELSKQ